MSPEVWRAALRPGLNSALYELHLFFFLQKFFFKKVMIDIKNILMEVCF